MDIQRVLFGRQCSTLALPIPFFTSLDQFRFLMSDFNYGHNGHCSTRKLLGICWSELIGSCLWSSGAAFQRLWKWGAARHSHIRNIISTFKHSFTLRCKWCSMDAFLVLSKQSGQKYMDGWTLDITTINQGASYQNPHWPSFWQSCEWWIDEQWDNAKHSSLSLRVIHHTSYPIQQANVITHSVDICLHFIPINLHLWTALPNDWSNYNQSFIWFSIVWFICLLIHHQLFSFHLQNKMQCVYVVLCIF